MSPNAGLARSYALCKRIARSKAKNFYYAFVLLPKEKRDALCAVYAFMRLSDDTVDEAGADRKARLDAWRGEVEAAFRDGKSDNPVLPALIDTIKRFSIPEKYFRELLDGMGMDLDRSRYDTFDELYRYCYHVASVVGLVCVHIFGFDDPKALEYAEAAGIAFQLTNILRDIREDFREDRVYIPAEDLQKFRYQEKNLAEGTVDDRFRRLLHFEIERARDYYHQSEGLLELIHPESRKALSALVGIYRGLLEKISRQHDLVFEKRIHLSILEKLSIVYRAWRSPAERVA